MPVPVHPMIHGRFEHGFAWMPDPDEPMERSSAALRVDGGVWIVDPARAPGIETEIEALGPVRGIIVTIGWHDRDVDWFAGLYGVPVYVAHHLTNILFRTPVERVDGRVPGTPFQLLDTSMRGPLRLWSESALWWPEAALLVTGDALGRASYFVRPGERLAVHPLVRLSPPYSLRGLAPRRIYCGHGPSLDEGAAEALERALDVRLSALPSAWWHAVTAFTRATVRHQRR